MAQSKSSSKTRGNRASLASLPKVDKLLKDPAIEDLTGRYSKRIVTDAVRDILDMSRQKILSGDDDAPISEPTLLTLVEEWLVTYTSPSLVPVINATGVVLHTNLGRAPLGKDVLENVVRVASGYSNLEFTLEDGERGSRYDHVAALISEITGAEDAIVVNNNAAAVLLALDTLAVGREVIVSRGELVEIGGAFRIPDVMKKSGARLVEVGTTNRTRIDDYRSAIGPETALIMKVHTSNYRIVGFVEDVPASELSRLARERGIGIMEDLGSGCLVDLSRYGLPPEPTVMDTVRAGVDVVTFSGDKLLGGGQAGFIIGKKDIVERIRKNPLNRALRIDKLTLAAIEATLLLYRDSELALRRIPTLAMLTMTYDETKRRARRIRKKLNAVPHPKFDVLTGDEYSRAGGGSFPAADIKTHVVTLLPIEISPQKLGERLRSHTPPIISRITDDRVIIDPRTVRDTEIPMLIRGILFAFGSRE
jgi:L-seryl-tRNA(Ser) seleniumtransferase